MAATQQQQQNEGTENTATEADVTQTAAPTVEQLQETITGLQAQVTALTKEATKHRKVRQSVEQERNELLSRNSDDYKQLWTEEKARNDEIVNKMKTVAMENAVRSQLIKLNITPSAVDAAVKLIDKQIIEFTDDNMVDPVSVEAAAQKLKKDYTFMFEKSVTAVKPVTAAATDKTVNSKTITRSDFDKLDISAKLEKIKTGVVVVD